MCVCLARVAWVERGLMDEMIGSGFTNPVGTVGVFDVYLCFVV